MNLKPLFSFLAAALVIMSLNAADQPLNAALKIGPATPASGDNPPATPLDAKQQQRLKRAHHLAEKSANNEFLNSPEGIGCDSEIGVKGTLGMSSRGIGPYYCHPYLITSQNLSASDGLPRGKEGERGR